MATEQDLTARAREIAAGLSLDERDALLRVAELTDDDVTDDDWTTVRVAVGRPDRLVEYTAGDIGDYGIRRLSTMGRAVAAVLAEGV